MRRWTRKPKRFQVKLERSGELIDIRDVVLPASGISYSIEYEQALVARWWGMTLSKYEALSMYERTRMTAVYRMNARIETVGELLAQERANKE